MPGDAINVQTRTGSAAVGAASCSKVTSAPSAAAAVSKSFMSMAILIAMVWWVCSHSSINAFLVKGIRMVYPKHMLQSYIERLLQRSFEPIASGKNLHLGFFIDAIFRREGIGRGIDVLEMFGDAHGASVFQIGCVCGIRSRSLRYVE